MGAAVNETVMTTADKLRAPLLRIKARLEKEIDGIQLQENEVKQTPFGEEVNVATNGSTVKPTRPVGTPTETLKRIGKEIYLFFIVLLLFILEHQIVLYLILAFIVYKLLRLVFARFFTRDA